jgi:hypothetical protein
MNKAKEAVMSILARHEADYHRPLLLETLRGRMVSLLDEKHEAEFRAVFASWPGPAIAEALAVIEEMLAPEPAEQPMLAVPIILDGNSSAQTNTLTPTPKRGPGRPRKVSQ